MSDVGGERVARLWTPERVQLTVPLAGLGERALAYLVDLLVLSSLLAAVAFLYNMFYGDITRAIGALSPIATLLLGGAVFAFFVLYDVVFEVLGNGRTPGKRAMKLRVLTSSGTTPDALVSILRNAMRLVDVLPFGYGVAIVTMFFTRTRRLGDLVADTFVVNERAHAADPLALCKRACDQPAKVRRPWSDQDVLLALSMIERTAQVDTKTAQLLAHRALKKIDEALAKEVGADGARAALAAQCLAHAEAPTGIAAQLSRLAAAERELRKALARVVKGCTIEDVERADLAVRRGASELMRASRRDVPARHLESLSLSLLEAERRRAPKQRLFVAARQFFAREVPTAVWTERKLILRAGTVLGLGLLMGGALAYADAEIAKWIVGEDLAREIERGARWTNQIEQNDAFAGVSLQIIVNNVLVGVRVFALGLVGAVGTLLGLLSNGVQIGATFGYAVQLGTADTLLRFILAHGPIELTMISIAGAGGLCLGRAIVSPGRRTRMQALREEGAKGARLLVAASMGFMCIGVIEGFVSPGELFPTVFNATLGFSLLALFWLWARAFGNRGSTQRTAGAAFI